jgi:predicted MPP superfamily phosphohydrolase
MTTADTAVDGPPPRCGFRFGGFGRLHVRREHVRLGLPRPVRALYACDLHLGHWWTAPVAGQLLAAARRERPDLTLLGGDMVDRRGALPHLAAAVRGLRSVAPVLAVPGNHDARAGLAAVRGAVRAAGGHWLPDGPGRFSLRVDAAVTPRDGGEPRLLCAHDPSVFPAAAAAGYPLVLAGHLHGGQCVLATAGGRLYPAAWFGRWHALRLAEGGSTLLVSRGAADTLPLRSNCPREVLLCELT